MKEYKLLPDEELICLIREGKENCMDLLIERYRGMVKNQARTLYLIGGDQEDLIQEGMIGLFKAVRDYSREKVAVPGNDGFAAFAKLCVSRQLYSAVKASNRQKHAPLNSYVELSPDIDHVSGSPLVQDPEALIIAQEDVLDLQERFRKPLSGFERQVLDLYLDGANYHEIAEHLGKSPKSIDNALQRIRRKVELVL